MLIAAFAPLGQRLHARPFGLRILAARYNYQQSIAHRRLMPVALALDGSPSHRSNCTQVISRSWRIHGAEK